MSEKLEPLASAGSEKAATVYLLKMVGVFILGIIIVMYFYVSSTSNPVNSDQTTAQSNTDSSTATSTQITAQASQTPAGVSYEDLIDMRSRSTKIGSCQGLTQLVMGRSNLAYTQMAMMDMHNFMVDQGDYRDIDSMAVNNAFNRTMDNAALASNDIINSALSTCFGWMNGR